MPEPRGLPRLYRWLLLAYPAQFRQDYERDILLVFRREWRSQPSPLATWWYFLSVATAILLNAPKEHLDMWTQDLRYALRALRRNPLFAVVAIGTLALGVGVNTALFSVVKSVLFGELPYAKPDELVRVWIRNPKQGIDHDLSNLPRLEDWSRAKSLSGVCGFSRSRLILVAGDSPLELRGAAVTANFFRVLGVQPLLGRDFDAGDDQGGRLRKVILSHALWLGQFGGDPAVVGRLLSLSGETYQVAGVAPPRVRFPERDLDFWTPLVAGRDARQARGGFWLDVAGRLRTGVPLAQAEAEMDTLSRALARLHPEDRDLDGIALVPLRDDLTGPIRPALLVLTGAVVFILLICCANIAGMLAARGAGRAHELSVRAALGAGRSRVVRQFLTEAVLLFSLGGACGLLAGFGGVALLVRLAPADLPQLRDTHLDVTVALGTLGVSLLSGLAFGLLPALQVARRDLATGIRQGARGLASGRLDTRRLRTLLTVGQLALAMVLLTGSWLLVRSFQKVEHVSPGFDPHQVSVAQIHLPPARYRTDRESELFFERLLERLRQTPGIDSAATISTFFLGRLPASSPFWIEGRSEQVMIPLAYDAVSPGFFRAMRTPLLRGRGFDGRDAAGSLLVTILNQAAAARYWPHSDPLGQRITFDDPGSRSVRWFTIVGVVGNTSRAGADQPVFIESYQPFAQSPLRNEDVLIRGTGVQPALRSALQAIDPQQPVARFTSLESALGDRLASRRFTTLLLTLFAGTALAITAVGLYGLISFLVTERRREFGIRVALGAHRSRVLAIVAGRVGALTAVGIVLGTVGALLVTKLLASLLFGVTRFDLGSYLAAVTVLVGVSLVAAVSPALRALSVRPETALRGE